MTQQSRLDSSIADFVKRGNIDGLETAIAALMIDQKVDGHFLSHILGNALDIYSLTLILCQHDFDH